MNLKLFSCVHAYAYVERITGENSTRRISELVLLLMFLFLLMFMSKLFSVVLTLMLELVLML